MHGVRLSLMLQVLMLAPFGTPNVSEGRLTQSRRGCWQEARSMLRPMHDFRLSLTLQVLKLAFFGTPNVSEGWLKQSR